MRESSFTLDDFLEQLDQVKNLGPLDDIMKMIPGMNKMKGLDKLNMSEKQIDHIKAIIRGSTPLKETIHSMYHVKSVLLKGLVVHYKKSIV